MRPEELSHAALRNMTRNEVVPIYVTMLQENVHPDQVRRINGLIIVRWSTSALLYIKERAWQIYDPDGKKFLNETI
jgi:hypothetical protein